MICRSQIVFALVASLIAVGGPAIGDDAPRSHATDSATTTGRSASPRAWSVFPVIEAAIECNRNTKAPAPAIQLLEKLKTAIGVASSPADLELEIAAIAGVLIDDVPGGGLQSRFISAMEQGMGCEHPQAVSELWRSIEATDSYKALLEASKEKPSAEDHRTTETTTFVADIHGALPGDDDEERLLIGGQGFYPAKLDSEGKEIIPPYRVLMKFDPQQSKYAGYFTLGDGKLNALNPYEQFPGGLLRAPNFLSFRLRGRAEGDIYLSKSLDLKADFREIDERTMQLATSMQELDADFDVEAIRLRETLKHRPLDPVISLREPFALPIIERTLKIGTADSDRPVDFFWSDAGEGEFVVVDERLGKAYRQFRDANGVHIQEYKLISPAKAGVRASEDGKLHYSLRRDKLDATGFRYSVDDEYYEKRGWILRAADGSLFKLEEDLASVKGDLSSKVIPPKVRPILNVGDLK